MGVTNFEGIEEEIRSVAGLGEEWYLV